MLNYDFFKSQVIFKHQIIKNSTPETFFYDIKNYYLALELLLSFNYNNEIINKKKEEIKIVIDNVEIDNKNNYIKKTSDKNYIYIQTEIDPETEEYFEEFYDEDEDIVIFLHAGIFNNYLENEDIVEKVDYTIFSLGHFNNTNYQLNNCYYINKFKECINIGYNTSANFSFPGISIGFPFYNNHYKFYNSIEIFEEIIKENFISLYKNFENILKNVNNFNLLNLFSNDTINLIKQYDKLEYISIQDMLNFLNLKPEDINILYQDNDYLLINKNDNIYPELLNKFKNKFLKVLSEKNIEYNNKYSNSKITFLLKNEIDEINNIDIDIGKEIKKKDVSISKGKKISLDNYFKNIDKSIDDTILF